MSNGSQGLTDIQAPHRRITFLPQQQPEKKYTGRFAPSPSGPLHFGSLVAAVASYCDAKAHDGRWLVRMEDIDQPRCVPGADRVILNTLRRFGFQPDGPVLYQSHPSRQQAYATALNHLKAQKKIFYCTCTRKQLKTHPVYPGTCRQRHRPPRQEYAIRVIAPEQTFTFTDRIQGSYQQHLSKDCGDFIVLRKNGYYAYQLAVVVDDADQGITSVVRGIDIIDSTPRQQFLQHSLGLPTLRYAHIPIIVDAKGHKLSKQTFAKEITHEDPLHLIRQALACLNQPPPPADITLTSLWDWAIRHWDIKRIRGEQLTLPADNTVKY